MGDSDDENFVSFGCALEPLDEENLPRKKAVTAEDQYALDAQGRRRFHGAFTGGFSAGYFNSVGTRDGWKPRQFKSSRSSKAREVSQTVQDFMDEEDTGEFGIAPTAIRATSDFTDCSRRAEKRERPRQCHDGPIPGVPVLTELLRPAKDTVGIALLKKMGWRPGQGIGPRVTKREKAQTREKNRQVRIYGCSLPNQQINHENSGSESSEDECNKILFAPDDYEPFRCNPKVNNFGIGYTGLDRRPVLSEHVNLFETPAFKLQDKNRKLSIHGQAFGVGAFEADDEDIYQREDMTRYDFALGPAERSNKSRWSRKEEPEASIDKCLEGFVPSKGELSRKKNFQPPQLPREFKAIHVMRKSRFFPPIGTPAVFDANGKRLVDRDLNAKKRAMIIGDPSASEENENKVTPEIGRSQVADRIIARTLNIHGKKQVTERREQEESKSRSNWLEKLTSRSFVSGGVVGNEAAAAARSNLLRDIRVDISDVSPKQFSRPFQADSDKQLRFDEFLKLSKEGTIEKMSRLQPLSMTEWEREHEREEFEQAARLLANSASTENESIDLLKKYSSDSVTGEKFVSAETDETDKRTARTLEEQMKDAAKMKLFGKLTRERDFWQPASIVCKRFNIPEPRTGCAKPSNQVKNKRYSVFDSLDYSTSSERFELSTEVSKTLDEPHTLCTPKARLERKTNNAAIPARACDVFDIADSSCKSAEEFGSFEASYIRVFGREISSVSPAEATMTDVSGRANKADEITPQRSAVAGAKVENSDSKDSAAEKKDLFKAIFLSSSEDSDTENPEDEEDSEAVKSLLIGKAVRELNAERNTSPPRGIFAKLDLDSLTKPTIFEDSPKSATSTREDKTEKDSTRTETSGLKNTIEDRQASNLTEMDLLPNMYGPVLPSKTTRVAESTPGNIGATSSKDVEAQKPIFRSVVVAKIDGPIDESKVNVRWVERSKVKRSKKGKHRHRHKEKERSKHKHKKKDKR